MTKSHLHRITLGSFAALALFSAPAFSESQYGSGTGTVTAQAHVNFSVTVPKMILLRVGSAALTDTLSWTSALSVATTPTSPIADVNQPANWSGTAPTASTTANPSAVDVYAWTNAVSGGSLSYTATNFGAGGPTLNNINVTATSGLAHPAPLALETASTSPVTISTNAVTRGSWTYALGGTPASWLAGTYTAQVVYTATSL